MDRFISSGSSESFLLRMGWEAWALVVVFLCLSCATTPQASAQILDGGDFEKGLDDWFAIGPVQLTLREDPTKNGCCACLVSDRSEEWTGVGQYITNELIPGRTYAVSARAKLVGSEEDTFSLKMRQIDAEGTQWIQLAQGFARSDRWREFRGAFTYEPVGEVESLRFFASGPQPGVDFILDDCSLSLVDDDWHQEALDRIDQIRKRDVVFQVTDAEGCPLPEAVIEVRHLRRRFAFGSCFNKNQLNNQQYLDFFKDNFEWAVHENAAKWVQNEWNQGVVTYDNADAVLVFCRANDIRMRGHCVFWANPIRVPAWAQSLDDDGLRAAVDARIESAVLHFRGDFAHWDVNNEMITNRFFADRLGDDIRPHMFQLVEEHDPDVVKMVNDFNVITSNRQSALRHLVESLESGGAIVDALGAQGHFPKPVSGELLLSRLDNLALAGKPIWITEYDCSASDPDVRADALETIFTAAFSHPSVEGLLMWGFWADQLNNGPNAAIVESDWTLNAAGIRYQALMDQWKTEGTFSVDPDGTLELRAFHGDYCASVIIGGVRTEIPFTLTPGTQAFHLQIPISDLEGCGRCPADLDGDGRVDGVDLARLLAEWGRGGVTDLDDDGLTGGSDLAVLLAYWGDC